MNDTFFSTIRLFPSFFPNWPLLIWLVAIALTMGLVGGLNTAELISLFDASFGRSLGEFALILLPSLILAAAMGRYNADTVTGLVVGASPLAGAGMICASTAYAALSPAAGKHRLNVAFGANSGFKLLYPAGPLVVATGLGVETDSLLTYGFALLIPVWVVGILWVHFHREENVSAEVGMLSVRPSFCSTALTFSPFLLLTVLLIVGSITSFPNFVLLEFITQPKGALILSAIVALIRVTKDDRRECIDTAIRQTGELILIIGITSAFGGMLTHIVPLESFIPAQAGVIGIVSLFLLAVVFKLSQGGSMTVFVTVAPVAAPLVEGMGISPVVAVFSICLGTFVAILPNDSFYWMVRRDVLMNETESRAIAILGGGPHYRHLLA